jgi:predicted ATPase
MTPSNVQAPVQAGVLHAIRVHGYKSLADCELTFGPVNVLIGPNGAGKSNLLSFLEMVARLRTRSLRRFVAEQGGASSLLHQGAHGADEIAFELEFRGEAGAHLYRARLAPSARDDLFFVSEDVEHRSGDGPARQTTLGEGQLESELASGRHDEDAAIVALRRSLQSVGFFHFHDTSPRSPLRTPARPEEDRYLRWDGTNLAAYLLAMRDSHDPSLRRAWTRIQRLLQSVAPFVKELDPTPTDTGPGRMIRLDWIDESDCRFGVHQISDGTLRMLALLTALAQPATRMPRFVSVDEPELGLHPAALAVLAGVVRSASATSRILLATQSPALLDHFDAGQVVVAERHDGGTVFRRLDPDRLRDWLDRYRLSELFDKNVLGGRP